MRSERGPDPPSVAMQAARLAEAEFRRMSRAPAAFATPGGAARPGSSISIGHGRAGSAAGRLRTEAAIGAGLTDVKDCARSA